MSAPPADDDPQSIYGLLNRSPEVEDDDDGAERPTTSYGGGGPAPAVSFQRPFNSDLFDWDPQAARRRPRTAPTSRPKKIGGSFGRPPEDVRPDTARYLRKGEAADRRRRGNGLHEAKMRIKPPVPGHKVRKAPANTYVDEEGNVTGDQDYHPRDYLKENTETAGNMKHRDRGAGARFKKDEPKKRLGVVPKYIKVRKQELARAKSETPESLHGDKSMENTMPESERLQLLADLQLKRRNTELDYQKFTHRSMFPARVKAQMERLEAEMDDLDEMIQKLSAPGKSYRSQRIFPNGFDLADQDHNAPPKIVVR